MLLFPGKEYNFLKWSLIKVSKNASGIVPTFKTKMRHVDK